MREELGPRTESQRIRSILTHENGNGNGKHPTLRAFTDENFVAEVLDVKDQLVVLDFWAEHCVPCRLVHESMLRLQQDLPSVRFGRVDVDKNPELVRAFELKAVPHVVAIMGGDVVMEFIGDRPYLELRKKIGALAEALGRNAP